MQYVLVIQCALQLLEPVTAGYRPCRCKLVLGSSSTAPTGDTITIFSSSHTTLVLTSKVAGNKTRSVSPDLSRCPNMSEQRLVIHTCFPQIYFRTASLTYQPRTHPYTDEIFPTRIKWPATKYTRDPTTNTLVVAPCCPQYTPWTPPNMTPRLAAQRLADHDRRLWNLSRNADEYRARRTALRDDWRRKREAWLALTPSFPRFADLPTELRLHVWELAAQDPGPVDLVVAPFGAFQPAQNDGMNVRRLREGLGPLLSLPSDVRTQTVIPLLHVNREAYAAVRPYYRPLNPLTQFQSVVPIGEKQHQHEQQQCDHDSNRGKTVLAAYPTVLHMNQWALTRYGFEATQLRPQLQGSDMPVEQRALLTELVIDVSARSFNLYGSTERKLREYFISAPCLRKVTIKARSNTAGVTCPDLDLLHAFWHFRYWALERPTRVAASDYMYGIYNSDWVAPEVAVIVCNPGSGQTAEEDELVLCHCERGLLGVCGLKWNSSPGVTVNSSLDITDVSGILNPVLLPLANEIPDDPGWWG